MIALLYLALFIAAVILVMRDKTLDIAKTPCAICLSRYLVLAGLALLFVGAESFSLLATHRVWVISGVMALSITGFLFAAYFIWERKNLALAALQMCYVLVITVHFYSWW